MAERLVGDPATEWRGVWAYASSTGRRYVVRVRIIGDWPPIDAWEFRDLLEAANAGRRVALTDHDRMRDELAKAPIGPVGDFDRTVSAQLRGLIGGGS